MSVLSLVPKISILPWEGTVYNGPRIASIVRFVPVIHDFNSADLADRL
jgi:hypothetical protein